MFFRNKGITGIVVLLAVCAMSMTIFVSSNEVMAASVKYSEQKKQYNSQNIGFNFDGKRTVRIIGNSGSNKAKIYYSKNLKRNGKAVVSLDNRWGNHVALKGKTIFYIDAAKGKLIRCNLSGKKKKTIEAVENDNYEASFIISGKYVIYNSNGSLFCCNLSGKNKHMISDDLAFDNNKYKDKDVYAKENKVYYINAGGLNVYDIKRKSNIFIRHMNETDTLLNLEGKNLYYASSSSVWDARVSVYKINLKTNKVSKITSFNSVEPIRGITAASDKVFVTTGTGAGNGFAKVKKGKLVYKPYYKKYDLGADLGFYNKYVVLENYKMNQSHKFPDYEKMEKVK